MDPSTGPRPPCTRASTKPTLWLDAGSFLMETAPHRTAVPRATSASAWSNATSPPTGTASHRTPVSQKTSATRPTSKFSGSYDPLRNNNGDSDSTLSPVLLFNPMGIRDTLPTDDNTAPSVSLATVGADAVSDARPQGTLAKNDLNLTNNEIAPSGDISVALLSVNSKIDAVSSRMMEAIRSLHEEVRSNHGHVTKQLIKPLEGRVLALEERTVRLEEELTKKGSTLLATVEELHETAAHIAAVVDHATNYFGSRLLALKAVPCGNTSTTTATASCAPTDHAPIDPPASGEPSADGLPPVEGATANSCVVENPTANSQVAWARVHHRVTPPWVPTSQHGPQLCQTTLPGAFQPRRSPERVDDDASTEAPGRAAASPTPGRIDHTLPMVFPDSADTSDIVGGPITSPRHWDKESQVRSIGASRFDATRLACRAYHVGEDGVSTLTEDIICNCGFTRIKASADDVMVCYNDIMYVHKRVWELWYNSSSHT
jgi:hypothetical protein